MLINSLWVAAGLLLAGGIAVPFLSRGAHAGRVAGALGVVLALCYALQAMVLNGASSDLLPRAYLAAWTLLPPLLMQTAIALRNIEVQRHHLIVFVWISGGLLAAFCADGDAVFALLDQRHWGAQPMLGPLGTVTAAWAAAVVAITIIDGLFQLIAAADPAERQACAFAVLITCLFALAGVDWLVMLGAPWEPWGHLAGVIGFLTLLVTLALTGGPIALSTLTSHGTLDASQDAVLMIDGTGRVQVANRAAQAILGQTRRQLLGAPVAKVLGVDTDHLEAIANQHPLGHVERLSLAGAGPGAHRQVMMQATVLRNFGGFGMATLALLRHAAPESATDVQSGIKLIGPELFETLLERELRLRAGGGGPPGALLLVALEGAQLLSQQYGETARQELERAVAERLDLICDWPIDMASLRDGVYALLITGLADEQELRALSERAVELLAAAWPVAGETRELPALLAVIPDLRLYHAVPELLADGDSGLELARRGEQPSPVYLQATARAEAAFNLETAIRNDSVDIEYTPVVDLGEQAVAGFRARLRWSPLGIAALGTAELQRLARRCHLEEQLFSWLIARLCDDLSRWQSSTSGAQGPRVWVPLSGDDLLRPGLASALDAQLKSAGVDPQALIIEVRAADLLQPGLRMAVRKLGQIGVRLHLSDFSAGSTAALLAPGLKIHSGSIAAELVRAQAAREPAGLLISGLKLAARSLNMRLLAEGVGDAAQLSAAIAAEMDYAQGAHIGAALDQDRVQAWLVASRSMKKLFSDRA